MCPSGLSCLARIARLNNVPTKGLVPTLLLIDIPEDDDENERKRSLPTEDDNAGEESSAPSLYGSRLLRQIMTDIKEEALGSMVLPVAVKRRRVETPSSAPSTTTQTTEDTRPSHPRRMPSDAAEMQLPLDQASAMKYIDLGAIDVLDNPIRREALPSLAIHVYRVHKEFLQRGEHLSAPSKNHESPWPGVPTPEPFAYLREVMVSDLAGQICGTIVEHPLDPVAMDISDARKQAVIKAIADWDFSAHDLSEDELMYASVTMLEHALRIDGMEEFRLPTGTLRCFASVEASSGPMMLPPVRPAC